MATAEGFKLVYEYKCNGRNIVPHGLSVLHEEDLVLQLSMHDDVRVVKKAIKPKSTSVDIYKTDLMTEEEKKAAAKAKKGGEANEEVPWRAFLGHDWVNHEYTEMLIVVPEVVAKGGKEDSK
ncbi:hypothetical protein PRZ48_004818 [Zasmidium cellare]|uniref:Uncharacterized protein n=1 Tax=Zasmidium cellare TaxID=395010 RepID=A0ABR0EST0_ZASCE|nr:hypothetical protein PRZ48_004818 [Zasmidium cellare]